MQWLLHTWPRNSRRHCRINMSKNCTWRKHLPCAPPHLYTLMRRHRWLGMHSSSIQFFSFGLLTILSLLAAFCRSCLRHFEPKHLPIPLLFAFAKRRLMCPPFAGVKAEWEWKRKIQNGCAQWHCSGVEAHTQSFISVRWTALHQEIVPSRRVVRGSCEMKQLICLSRGKWSRYVLVTRSRNSVKRDCLYEPLCEAATQKPASTKQAKMLISNGWWCSLFTLPPCCIR